MSKIIPFNKNFTNYFLKSFSLLIVIPLFMSFGDIDRTNNRKTICWDKGNKLHWSDFKGRPPRHTSSAAMTYVSFKYDYPVVRKDELNVSLTCCFNKKESWVKKDSKTDYILNHEQLHFDIGELYIRKMRQEISQLSGLSQKQIFAAVDKIFELYRLQYIKYQALYDKETDHSRNEDIQNEWNTEIAKELNLLELYSEPVLNLRY